MKLRPSLAAVVPALAVAALLSGCASAPPPAPAPPPPGPEAGGTATGTLLAGPVTVQLSHAYAVVVRPRKATSDQTRILLTERPVPVEVLDDLLRRLPNAGIRGVEVTLDSQGIPLKAGFFHEDLPAGLEVTAAVGYAPKPAPAGSLAGRLEYKEAGNSFSFEAEFQTPVYRPPQKPERPIDPNLPPKERARLELTDEGLPLTSNAFLDTVRKGDAETVQLFLDAGMPAGASDPSGSAIRAAVERDDVKVAKILLQAGANPNEKGPYGQSLALAAVDKPGTALLEALIGAGADVNVGNDYRVTPLMAAAEQVKKGAVDLLLAHGANVNARTPSGGTALQVAVLRGSVEIVKALIAAGADVRRDGKELLKLAKDNDHKEVESVLREALKHPARKPRKK